MYLDKFLIHLNSLHNNIKFTIEIEKDGHWTFLDIDIQIARWIVQTQGSSKRYTYKPLLDHKITPPAVE